MFVDNIIMCVDYSVEHTQVLKLINEVVRFWGTKSICKNQLYFYIIAVNNLKMKFGQCFIYKINMHKLHMDESCKSWTLKIAKH